LAIARLTWHKPVVLVLNKVDRPALLDPSPITDGHPSIRARVEVSAETGAGIADLAVSVAQTLLAGEPLTGTALVTNPRHRDMIGRAVAEVRDALRGLEDGLPVDLVAVHLTVAVQALGEITGETVGEDLLHEIFSRFCIGK
jgi:tRNA modification GTPase